MDKSTCRIKRISLYDGFIGKPVPLTPTFLGWFVLNRYCSKCLKPQISLVSVNIVKNELIFEV